MGQQGRAIVRRRPTLFLAALAAIAPFATTSVARQDAASLLAQSADAPARGRYLATAAQPLQLASLEADDLYGSGRGPMLAPNPLVGAEALVVLDLPDPVVESDAKSDQPAPFVDRTLKGDRRAVAQPAPRRPAGDPAAMIPPMALVLKPDLTGLNALPAIGLAMGGMPAAETPVTAAALPVATPGHAVANLRRGARADFTSSSRAAIEGETVASRFDGVETRLWRRIALPEAQLAKAEQCLAEAVYFEARGETVKGQYAVAQVVMNRVRSGYYPADVCGVVYQNARRRNACQFSFACDRIPDRVNNAYAWRIANRVARDVAQNGAWLPEVGDSTHYHATYVRPNWIRDMVKEDKIGRHIFYRVRWRAPLDA